MSFLVFIERWGLADGCEDCSLVNSEVPFRLIDWIGEKGVEEDVVLYPFLVQSLCTSGPKVRVIEEAFRVYVCKAIVDFVEHPRVRLLSSLFKALPLQIAKHGRNTAWWPGCVVGHTPGCLLLYFFEFLFFLFLLCCRFQSDNSHCHLFSELEGVVDISPSSSSV